MAPPPLRQRAQALVRGGHDTAVPGGVPARPGAYLVFASSHGLEYIVFIWAYQLRRYRDETARRETSPLLRHPLAFYLALTALVLGALFYANCSYQFPALASLPRVIFGEDAAQWLLWFTLYHGVLHFYFDGFLWKLRRPALLAHL